jgi:hypothetical protein
MQPVCSFILEPNARGQARQRAGARHERTLFAVACTPWFGEGLATDSAVVPPPPRENHLLPS